MISTAPLSSPQDLHAELRGRRVALSTDVRITPLGLIAAGVLVSAILLSVPPIIRAARAAAVSDNAAATPEPD